MGFMDAYKRLEKLCRDSLDDDRGVSAYIDEMQNTPRGANFVDNWNTDLKQLKHYRWVRNQIAHDPACTEENMCAPADEKWIKAFYKRIMEQTDPLALYRKATRKSKSVAIRKEQQKKGQWKWIALIVAAALLLLILAYCLWENTALQLNTYTVKNEKLPESFRGFRIAQVSDLHNRQMGANNEKLLEMLRSAEPDIIVITGDLVDSRETDVAVALHFAEKAMRIAPCYYVTGNHESRISVYEELKNGLLNIGVTVLENAVIPIRRADDYILLMGVQDPGFYADVSDEIAMRNSLQSFDREQGTFTVLLSHRPELFHIYVENNIDLVFSGHAHGGQIRLPFVGGLYAPNQGLFPEYDAGAYTQNGTTMFVSRGVGNSLFPLRFNNRPEVLLIQLDNGL